MLLFMLPLRVLLCLQWQKEEGNTLYIIVQFEDNLSNLHYKDEEAKLNGFFIY
ncbi:hypothetical protein GIB67_009631 [Kingdonia uniflora]|uniref:Uncharacterized protein n=1 Tax=Kingdonia uniflora TaxID=39325 RepID=A0A7J7M2D5_9MAGN|nr:hypothetical protein GIB67_028508 [Kingdonia uniflora]KAF6149012.1 hypothetical protein GIB67_009631 [Kingdonia uniflora]